MYLINVFRPENIEAGKRYTSDYLNKIKNFMYFTEEEANEVIKGKTFFENAVEFELLEKKIDYQTLAAYASLKFGVEIPEDPEASLHSMGFNGEKHIFMFLPDTSKSRNSFNLEIPHDELGKYTVYQAKQAYAVKTKHNAYARGTTEEGWSAMPCDNCEYTDDFDKVKEMVDCGGLPDDFIEKWDPEHSLFHPWW